MKPPRKRRPSPRRIASSAPESRLVLPFSPADLAWVLPPGGPPLRAPDSDLGPSPLADLLPIVVLESAADDFLDELLRRFSRGPTE
jgi:hypothetical protein